MSDVDFSEVGRRYIVYSITAVYQQDSAGGLPLVGEHLLRNV